MTGAQTRSASSGAVTPWSVGDVFVGAVDVDVIRNPDRTDTLHPVVAGGLSSPRYHTLAATGQTKVDARNVPVPDLSIKTGDNTVAMGCAVDPTIPNGDLWTTWMNPTALLKVVRFKDADHTPAVAIDLSTGALLAGIPRAAGTPPLPAEAVGSDPASASGDIQAFESIEFDKTGNFFVGTETESASVSGPGSGLGHAYLLKFSKNEPDGAGSRACPAVAGPCLLDWWRVDTSGAPASDRWTKAWKTAYFSALSTNGGDSSAAAGAANAVDLSAFAGTSALFGETGVDQYDLSPDGATIYYTSEDNNIRVFDTATGTQLPPIVMTSPTGRDASNNLIYSPTLYNRAYGLRLLPADPAKLLADGGVDPLGGGFIVATSGGIYRLDGQGHTLDIYSVPADSHVFALNLTPDAQSFWTATTINTGLETRGGVVARFHIGSRVMTGPVAVANAAFGLCVKREYTAAQGVCYGTNPDGTVQTDPQTGQPVEIACKAPPFCATAVIGENPDGSPNSACYPPGEHPLALPAQANLEGDTVAVDVAAANPDVTFQGFSHLPDGLSMTNGRVTGTIAWHVCDLPDPGCPITVNVRALDAAGRLEEGSFVWTVKYRNAIPTLSAPQNNPQLVVLSPAPEIVLNAFDADANDALLLTVQGAPPGMALNNVHIGYANGFNVKLVGTPQAAPPYPHAYQVRVDLFDCTADFASRTVLSGDAAQDLPVLNRALGDAADDCHHHVATAFPVTVVAQSVAHQAPVCSAAAPSQTLWPPNHKFVDITVSGVTDPDRAPVKITIASIWQDEPVDTEGSGKTLVDGAGIGTSIASVRAERTGIKSTPGDGRIYQINFLGDDGQGGTCTGSVLVGVPHDQGQMSMPIDSGLRFDSVTGARIR